MPNTELLVNKIRTKKHEEPSSINRSLWMKSLDKKNGGKEDLFAFQSHYNTTCIFNIYSFAI